MKKMLRSRILLYLGELHMYIYENIHLCVTFRAYPPSVTRLGSSQNSPWFLGLHS